MLFTNFLQCVLLSWGIKIKRQKLVLLQICLQCQPCFVGKTESYAKSDRTSSQGGVGLS